MEKEQKIRIGGIKFSEELIQVNVSCTSQDYLSICHLLHLIAEKNINISFLTHSVFSKTPESIFCVESGELESIRHIIKCSSWPDEHVKITSSVGTLTVFPHRNEMKLLGLIINFFGSCGFPVHSFSSSISTIAINTDYFRLDTIAEKLQSILLLPENHAPFRQGFRVTQIVV